MKTKAQKQEILAELKGQFADSPAIVVCKFEGLSVSQDQELRGSLRNLGARYRVVSNRLAQRAAEGTAFDQVLSGQRGMTALAFPGEDLIGAIKALVAYAKQEECFACPAGVVDGRALDAGELVALSKMPGREGVQAQLLYMINSSAQRLLGVLNAPGRDIAAVLDQGVKEKKFNEE